MNEAEALEEFVNEQQEWSYDYPWWWASRVSEFIVDNWDRILEIHGEFHE